MDAMRLPAQLPPADRIRAELAVGLLAAQAQISPKYFYNRLGSKIFEAICELDEYYPTRAEARILTKFQSQIAERTGEDVILIDLGAGNCEKAQILFNVLKPRQYVPIDISAEFLLQSVRALKAKNLEFPIHPLALDFAEGVTLPKQIRQDRRLFFYPGSSIGNYTPLEALQFLQRLRHACPGKQGALLIGIDLVKNPIRLEAAYDDCLGVTAAFNRNVLLHVNDLLGSNFAPSDWRHRAFFNAEQSRVEMHLEALKPVSVRWPQAKRDFACGETIHTENSYKYTKSRFLELLRDAGFGNAACWTDDDELFLVCHAEAI